MTAIQTEQIPVELEQLLNSEVELYSVEHEGLGNLRMGFDKSATKYIVGPSDEGKVTFVYRSPSESSSRKSTLYKVIHLMQRAGFTYAVLRDSKSLQEHTFEIHHSRETMPADASYVEVSRKLCARRQYHLKH